MSNKDENMSKEIKKKTNIRTILIEYLRKNNYDGLCNIDLECGCTIDDLIPCDYNLSECEPAYKMNCPCKNKGAHDACEYENGCMSVLKPKKDKDDQDYKKNYR